MDPLGHGQPSHSSYQRDWGYPYQMGPGHPHQWGMVNPYQMGPGHPHHWGMGNPYQMSPGHPYQRGSKKSFGRSKEFKKTLVCTRCQMDFNNQKDLDDHLSGSMHKKRIQTNQLLEQLKKTELDDHLSGSMHKKRIQTNQLLEQLKKTEPCFTHDSSKRIYLCHACNIGLNSPDDLEIHFYCKEHIANSELYRAGAVKSPPLRRNKTPCQYINPYLKAETCLSGRYSSQFWLDLIKKVYADLSPSNKQLFIEDMISQAHGSLHNEFHKKIVNAIIYSEGNQDERMVIELREAFCKKNMTFNCTCLAEISQEELDEVGGIAAENRKTIYCFQDIVDPYLSDTTCEGGEKSSLFWLSQIEEVYLDLSHKNKNKFVCNMTKQAHACLHKDYHGAIIKLLYGNTNRHRNYIRIDMLKIKYEKLNNKFVCTCETGMTQNVLQTEKNKESCADFNTTETKEELTYEDLLDILELDD